MQDVRVRTTEEHSDVFIRVLLSSSTKDLIKVWAPIVRRCHQPCDWISPTINLTAYILDLGEVHSEINECLEEDLVRLLVVEPLQDPSLRSGSCESLGSC